LASHIAKAVLGVTKLSLSCGH